MRGAAAAVFLGLLLVAGQVFAEGDEAAEESAGVAEAPPAAAAESVTDESAGEVPPASAVEKVAAVPKENAWRVELRAGGGYDSNVLQSAAADTAAATWMVRGNLIGRPLKRLSLQLEASHAAPLAIAALSDSAVTLMALYRLELTETLSLGVSSLSSYRRGLTVFTEAGTILPAPEDTRPQQILLRSELAEHLEAGLQASLGAVDLSGGGRLDVKGVSGAEVYGLVGLGGTLSARWTPNVRFSGRLRYAYTLRLFDEGLRGRNPYGGPLVVAGRRLELGVHELGPNAHVKLSEAVALRASYALEVYSDNFLGFLDGVGHRAQLAVQLDSGPFVFEAGGELRQRSFTLRRVSPTEPGSEASVGARLEASYFFGPKAGVYLRYELDFARANPTGVLYTQHLVTVGPIGRLALGGG
ncbi:MAG: hypothetical protein ACYC8T_25525 [Myxococcaceae bacterium]